MINKNLLLELHRKAQATPRLRQNFDLRTTDVSNLAVKGYVDGFATALQHMHIGDQWRIYIPHQLGYGTTAKSSIPAYSTLIFDLVLIDFVSGSDKMEPWSARGQY